MSNFARRLKELRTEKNVSQYELANFLHVSQNAIYNWENKKREPNADMIKKIADYFGVTPAYIMGWEGSNISVDEMSHIKKYRALDQHGKKVVDFLLEEEYSRQPTGQAKVIPEYLILNAAHAIEGVSPEDIQHDEDIMNDKDF